MRGSSKKEPHEVSKMTNNKNNAGVPPAVQCKVRLSKCGKYVIHQTIITDIKARKYYDLVLKDEKTKEVMA